MEKVYKRINWNTTVCNGSFDADSYLHAQTARAICLAAYERPLTIEEISVVTGLPTMYVEDELPKLEYGDAVKKIADKYAADFIILSLKDKSILQRVSAGLVSALADAFAERFAEASGKVGKLEFRGRDFGMERLGYIAVPYVLRNQIRRTKSALRFENGAFPVRKDGGYGWFIVEETEDEREETDAYDSGCNTAGDDDGSAYADGSYLYYYWTGRYFDPDVYHGYGIRWLCARGIPQNSVNGVVHTSLSDEEAAQLIHNGLICRGGGGYRLNFACFGGETFRDFVSLFEIRDAGIETALAEWIGELRKGFASFVPKRLEPQINQWVSVWANRLVGYVTEELIARGILAEPDPEKKLTDGVFYAEGRFIDSI